MPIQKLNIIKSAGRKLLPNLILESYIAYDQYGNIDYSRCFIQCGLNHDLGIRYGKDSTGAELAVIFNCYDADELWIRDEGE